MQSNRLIEIIWLLSSKKCNTAGDLAQLFGISTRTVYRDIDLLCSAGVPVASTKGKKGGLSLPKGYKPDQALLASLGQADAAQALQAFTSPDIGSSDNADNCDWIEVSLSSWKDNAAEQMKFDQIRSAIYQNTVLEFEYFNSLGQTSLRSANPLKLIFKGSAWYLYAYCPDRQDFRSFKTSRIRNLRVLNQHFNRDELPTIPPQSEPESASIDFVSLVLKIHPTMAYRVLDEFENFIRNEDKSFLIQVQMPPGEWLYSYLMSFGEYLEVLKPDWMRADLKKRFEAAASKYS